MKKAIFIFCAVFAVSLFAEEVKSTGNRNIEEQTRQRTKQTRFWYTPEQKKLVRECCNYWVIGVQKKTRGLQNRSIDPDDIVELGLARILIAEKMELPNFPDDAKLILSYQMKSFIEMVKVVENEIKGGSVSRKDLSAKVRAFNESWDLFEELYENVKN